MLLSLMAAAVISASQRIVWWCHTCHSEKNSNTRLDGEIEVRRQIHDRYHKAIRCFTSMVQQSACSQEGASHESLLGQFDCSQSTEAYY